MANKCKFGGWFADVNYRPKRKTSRGWFNINYKYSREMMLKLNPDQSKIPDFNANDSTYNADYDFEKANKRFEVSLSNEMNKNTAELDGKHFAVILVQSLETQHNTQFDIMYNISILYKFTFFCIYEPEELYIKWIRYN